MRMLAFMILSASFSQGIDAPCFTGIKTQAHTLIRQTIHAFTPETSVLLEEQLTDTELKAIGRYFESPSLGEVYPGIGEALRNPNNEKT